MVAAVAAMKIPRGAAKPPAIVRNHLRAGNMKRKTAFTLFAAVMLTAYAARGAFIWGEARLTHYQKQIGCKAMAEVLLNGKGEDSSTSNLNAREFGKVVKLIDKHCWGKKD
jgi:hypothetical protein